MTRPSPSYFAQGSRVFWGPYELSTDQCETLLGLFYDLGAAEPFNELHDAYVQSGGVPRAGELRSAA